MCLISVSSDSNLYMLFESAILDLGAGELPRMASLRDSRTYLYSLFAAEICAFFLRISSLSH
jgi:hypothetical protein